jgi:hypothetical protein
MKLTINMITNEKLVKKTFSGDTEDDMGKRETECCSAFRMSIAHASPTAAWFSVLIMLPLVAKPFASTKGKGKCKPDNILG